MEMPVYDLTNPNSLITKLKLNYRNHVDILHIPNTLFYDGELEVSIFLSYHYYKYTKYNEFKNATIYL